MMLSLSLFLFLVRREHNIYKSRPVFEYAMQQGRPKHLSSYSSFISFPAQQQGEFLHQHYIGFHQAYTEW